MEIEINMINVEDGDAIILTLKKEDKKALILIDGGYKKYYPKLKKRLEELLPSFDNKIDLVICTHYDNDHIGGIEKMLDDYHQIIQEIWIHKISDTLTEQVSLMKSELDSIEKIEEEYKRFKTLAGINEHQDFLIIEGYRDLLRVSEKLIQYDLESKTKEPTRGDYLEGFEEFTVISPTAKYYNSFLHELKGETFLKDIRNNISENKMILESFEEFTDLQEIRKGIDLSTPCSRLEKSSLKNSVTATNMVSIVTLLKANDCKYLFTGDAGIETFEDQNILDEDIKNLDWLDLPHHGSKNNTSEIMLSHFNPKTVFVSARGTANRPHYLIKQCLKNKETGDNIFVTNSDEETWYLKYDENGNTERILNT
ncbi:MBL fold metallo-hydrolase [Tenacibaculum sp. S7007]|uniref:MBL fold metallo-hydrolase n=1 Tax=Tenacibaculum pelagium TaxID=2759527 RepID=A0A839AQL8_9FLAO|nr:MBL fold metallo-hydrolase [Tenacibaculum pelagium]MBA6157375.1 MBL fold metallo-hydrolase [Tenacibaculum pelagium]